jgi:hypothetical protein
MTAGLLAHPPTVEELERLYHELALLGAPSVGRRRRWPYRPASREELIALAGEMLRYDARLLTVLLQLLLARWSTLDPLELRRQLARMRWPQSLLVVLEFARICSDDRELRFFADYLAAGWRRLDPPERFFLDDGNPASRGAVRRLGRNLVPYARWGLIGTERPVADMATRRPLGNYDPATRRRILGDIVERRGRVTISEYLDAMDGAVSRQQALADLRRHGRLAVSGRGRGAVWLAAREATDG